MPQGALPGAEVQSGLSLSQLHLLLGAVLEAAEKESAIVPLLPHPAPPSGPAEDPLAPQSLRRRRPDLEKRALLFRSRSLASAAAVARRRGGSWEKAAFSHGIPEVCVCRRVLQIGLATTFNFWGQLFRLVDSFMMI